MATFKIACPECGQKVSGDESFLGAIIDCPLCNTKIKFPKEARPVPEDKPKDNEPPPPPQFSPPPPEATSRSRSVRTSSAAVWSVIFGIAAIIFCPIGILFAVPAIVVGHSARASILSSFGKTGGQGFATAGLAIGYTYASVFFLAAVFVTSYIKPLASFFEQRINAESAKAIITAATSYAADHDKNLPDKLTDLVPRYLEGGLETFPYIEPGSLPPECLDFTYYPGHTTESGPRIILLSAPDADRSYQRLVGYLDGSIDVLEEPDFIRQSMKQ